MHRHVRQNCKIANTEEGMDKLMDYTWQRQLAEMRAENTEIRAQVDRLAGMFEKQLAIVGAAATTVTGTGPQVINTGSVVTNVANVTQVIQILPWDGESRIEVGVAQMAAAFAENARLREYARLPDHQLTDPELAPPYVAELLMDLVRRGHADPASRNVYLNPRRADQTLVHLESGRWEILPLAEATRLILDGVAQTIHRTTLSHEDRRQLPLEAQNALAMAGLLYDDGPDEYVRRARGPMAAHLTNMAPAPPPAGGP